jgi:methyl-accepting chemotaxis protein
MGSIDWTTIGTVASTVALVMGGLLWAVTKIFHFGRISQRLDSLETDLSDSKSEIKHEINTLRTDLNQRMDNLNQRMDKLILTIAESHGKR